jgi:hypothetical protein
MSLPHLVQELQIGGTNGFGRPQDGASAANRTQKRAPAAFTRVENLAGGGLPATARG